jgi:Uma2 family endonuclease
MNAIAVLEEEPQPLLLNLDDYRILHEAGAFLGRPKVELVGGIIYTVSPQKNLHSFVKSELALRLGIQLRAMASPLRAITEGTVAFAPDTALDPDITVTSDVARDGYIDVQTVRLIVEVSDASLQYDLETKARIYCRFAVPEYWVVDVQGRALHRHWRANQGEYAEKDAIAFGQIFESMTVPELKLESGGLL